MNHDKNSPQIKLIKKKPYKGKMLRRSLNTNAATCKANEEARSKQPSTRKTATRAHNRNLLAITRKASAGQKLRLAEVLVGA